MQNYVILEKGVQIYNIHSVFIKIISNNNPLYDIDRKVDRVRRKLNAIIYCGEYQFSTFLRFYQSFNNRTIQVENCGIYREGIVQFLYQEMRKEKFDRQLLLRILQKILTESLKNNAKEVSSVQGFI